MKNSTRAAGALLIGLFATACSQKEPAWKAIEAGEDAMAEVYADAQKYIPRQYAEVKTALEEARQAYDSGNYADALSKAQGLPAKAAELGQAAAAARETLHQQLTVEWQQFTAGLPGLLDGLQGRLTELEKARRLPEGVTKDAVERAGKGLAVARNAWSEALAAFEAGNLEGAATRAGESERLVTELMTDVGMTPPAGTDEPPAG